MEKQGPKKKLKTMWMAVPIKKVSTPSSDGWEAWKPFVPQIAGMPKQLAVEIDFEIVKMIKRNKGW